MKFKSLLLAFAVTVALFAVSCKKGGKTGLLVPKDAAFVVYFNTGSLSSKLSWAEIKQSDWFKEVQAEAAKEDAFTQKVLNDPAASGLDMDKGFCLFMAPRGRGNYIAVQGHIKDQKAFEEMLKSNKKTAGTPSKSGDLNVLNLDDKSVLTWNSTTFVAVSDAPGANVYAPMSGMEKGDASSSLPLDSIVTYAKNVYTLEGKELLDSDPKFADLIAAKGDLQMWFNASSMTNNMGMGMMSMLKLSTLTEGSFSTVSLSFDNGQINLDGKQYYGKELAKVFDKYSSKGVTSDLVNRLPGGDVLFAGAYSYPMGALMDMIKLIGADGIANMFLGQKGISMEDISKAFKGDMAFAISDISTRQDTVRYEGYDGKPASYTTTKSEPSYVFGVSIDDQKSFDKLYNIFQEEIKKVPASVASVKVEKGWLVTSNTPALNEGFFAGNNKPAYSDKLTGHQFGLYFNAQRLFTILDKEIKDSTGIRILNESKNVWKEALTNADYKNGSATFHLEINLQDKGTNSLKQLNKYADKIAAIHKENAARYQDAAVDSAVSVEAPPKAFN
ncbi:MAG: hypothetical protein DI535_09840 [Citrobacter freundii]|nr:MAG: hypothetical protein DI535_09840 [Citrobacter freundii]